MAEIRPAKFVPWVKLCVATILLLHDCAESFSRSSARSDGSPCDARCSLIRQTTAARIAGIVDRVAGRLASGQARA